MINVKEHIYQDDPDQGHTDVRTRLKDACYFFLGNGLIQAAVQFSPSGEGSPYGLLIMNPEKLGAKRQALNFIPDTGLEKTMIQLRYVGKEDEIKPLDLTAQWYHELKIPTVLIQYTANVIRVKEIFYCADRSTADVYREIRLKNTGEEFIELEIHANAADKVPHRKIALSTQEEKSLYIRYILNADTNTVKVEFVPFDHSRKEAIKYWRQSASINFNSDLINHLFNASNWQLPCVIAHSGKVDASIWQYCREWVRDHSFMAVGLTLSGHHEKARVVLDRLLREFVTPEGDCIDSSERRDPEDVELDQNGTLLWALRTYLLWSGDTDLISQHWEKIEKTAEFPLKDIFRHQPSGMFSDHREYWERHHAHGIKPGIELMYQVFPAIGLECASTLAKTARKHDLADQWEAEARRLKEAILNHPEYALVSQNGFIKRRGDNGEIQETIKPMRDSGLPDGVPLAADIEHYLQPDTCTAIPIALGFVPPDSNAASATMEQLELLWNQGWKIGGYGRYNMTSEPDSQGPWPFCSLIIAKAALEMGDFDKVWRILDWLNTLPGSLSGSWFEMYGSRIAPPYAQVGITPWTWAEIIMLLVHHILGIQPEEKFLRFRPKLLPGIEKVTGSLPFRNNRIHLDLQVDPGVITPAFRTSVFSEEMEEGEIHIFHDNQDIEIEGRLPAF